VAADLHTGGVGLIRRLNLGDGCRLGLDGHGKPP
jgi:hypothetical protein